MSGPIEPSADLWMMASALRQMYVALTLEGFTAQEALSIIGSCIAANSRGGQ